MARGHSRCRLATGQSRLRWMPSDVARYRLARGVSSLVCRRGDGGRVRRDPARLCLFPVSTSTGRSGTDALRPISRTGWAGAC